MKSEKLKHICLKPFMKNLDAVIIIVFVVVAADVVFVANSRMIFSSLT